MKFKKIFSLVITSLSLLALFSCNNNAPKEDINQNEGGHVHSYIDTVILPTCDHEGYTLHSCSCGDEIIDSYTNKLEHDGDFVCKHCNKDLLGSSFYKNMISSFKTGFSLDVSKICYEHLSLFTKDDITVNALASLFFDEKNNPIINIETKTTKVAGNKTNLVEAVYTSTDNAISKITYKEVNNNKESIKVNDKNFDDELIKNIAGACKTVVGYINTAYTFFSIFYKLLPLDVLEDIFDLEKTDTGYLMTFDNEAQASFDKYVTPLIKGSCADIFNQVILNFVGNEAYKQIFKNDAALFYSDIDNLTALLKSVNVSEVLALIDDYIGKVIPLSSVVFGMLYKDSETSFKNLTGLLNVINLCLGTKIKLDEEKYQEIKDLDLISALAILFKMKDSDKLIEIIHNALFNEDEGYMYRAPIDVLASLFYSFSIGVIDNDYRNDVASFIYFIKSYYVGLRDTNFYFVLNENGKIEKCVWDLSTLNYTNENNLTISNCENVVLEFGKKIDIDISCNKALYELYNNAKALIEKDEFVSYVSDTYFDKEEVSYTSNDDGYVLTCNQESYTLYEYKLSYNEDNIIIQYRFTSSDVNNEIIVYAYYDNDMNLINYLNN